MKSIKALMCSGILLLWSSKIQSQVFNVTSILNHNHEHSLQEFTVSQIDSIERLAQFRKAANDSVLKTLILNSRKVNQNQKSDDCSILNWGFENGDLSHWTTSGQVSLVNGGNDSYGNFPNVHEGNNSLKLGDDDIGEFVFANAARTYTVPQDGQTFITFHFATSIFNFPHNAMNAAKFRFNLFDENSNVLPCPIYEAYYTFDQGPVGIPNLQETTFPADYYNPNVLGDPSYSSNVTYSNWHHVTIDLTQYAGTDVTLVFSNEWCYYGIDWIYTIIDVDCPINTSMPIPGCLNGQAIELSAPQGMDASYIWTFNGNLLNNNEACVNINQSGLYQLNFSPAYLECSQNDYLFNFPVVDSPLANFSLDEICFGSEIFPLNQSQDAFHYKWIYGSQSSQESSPSFVFEDGQNLIELIVQTAECFDTIKQELIVHSLPILDFSFENQCLGNSYFFQNNSIEPEGGMLNIEWQIGADLNTDVWSPSFIPSNDEPFQIKLSATNQFGCSIEKDTLGKAVSLPFASFYVSDSILFENVAQISLINNSSLNSVNWEWIIDDQLVSTTEHHSAELNGLGQHIVQLVALNELYCTDTAMLAVQIKPDIQIYIPNTFTPNADMFNQVFKPVFSGSDIQRKNYQFQIFDRWGKLIFETKDLFEGWGGMFLNKNCPQGTYSWKLAYVKIDDKKLTEQTGHVNLVR
jgi:gliding motility-associated-like protein